MRLYVYRNEDGNLTKYETEVEKKEIYVPKEGSYINGIIERQFDVSDIGKIIGFGKDTVVLESGDIASACKVFRSESSAALKKIKRELKNLNKQIGDKEHAVN